MHETFYFKLRLSFLYFHSIDLFPPQNYCKFLTHTTHSLHFPHHAKSPLHPANPTSLIHQKLTSSFSFQHLTLRLKVILIGPLYSSHLSCACLNLSSEPCQGRQTHWKIVILLPSVCYADYYSSGLCCYLDLNRLNYLRSSSSWILGLSRDPPLKSHGDYRILDFSLLTYFQWKHFIASVLSLSIYFLFK